MSRVFFELKAEHLKLLKFTNWSLTQDKLILSKKEINDDDEDAMSCAFGGNDVYEEMDLILNGKVREIEDIFEVFEPYEYDEDTKAGFDLLLSELPTALEIILYTQSFTLGRYTTIYNQKEWQLLSSN